jgi:hypothetical protein
MYSRDTKWAQQINLFPSQWGVKQIPLHVVFITSSPSSFLSHR